MNGALHKGARAALLPCARARGARADKRGFGSLIIITPHAHKGAPRCMHTHSCIDDSPRPYIPAHALSPSSEQQACAARWLAEHATACVYACAAGRDKCALGDLEHTQGQQDAPRSEVANNAQHLGRGYGLVPYGWGSVGFLRVVNSMAPGQACSVAGVGGLLWRG